MIGSAFANGRTILGNVRRQVVPLTTFGCTNGSQTTVSDGGLAMRRLVGDADVPHNRRLLTQLSILRRLSTDAVKPVQTVALCVESSTTTQRCYQYKHTMSMSTNHGITATTTI